LSLADGDSPVLTKDLLRVSRRGGGYQPQFGTGSDEPLAGRVIGCYQGHVGETRGDLQEALTAIERDSDDFKLVRGFAKLLDREAVWETDAVIDPPRAREAAFEAAETVGVVTAAEREQALERAADNLGSTADALEDSLYADRECREILTELSVRWTPADLVDRYNLSLVQTALFDSTEVRIRSTDPRELISAIKWHKLMYEVHTADGDWEIVVTGPDALFRATRRYGTRFAKLLRTVASAAEWDLTATIDDRGTERTMQLSDDDPITVPSAAPEVSFDSDIEADFAARFNSLDLDWELVREPEPLVVGESVMIPDFAFDYRFADFRLFFEIMGFWTPEYVEKKLDQLDAVDDVELLVAVDESLGVSEEIEARDHRAITYSGSIRLKDVRRVLRRYEDELERDSASDLPDELRPDADTITLAELAADHGVSESVVDDLSFPDHERVGRTLVRPAVLDALASELEAGMDLEAAEEILEEYDLSDTSAVLAELGYRVEWEGLGGGTVKQR
jgi:predicted nuclease of restriction endonuclease-like RecB superfamily